MRTSHSARVVSFGALVAAIACPHPARAQNPISSKVVGSDVARRNRRLLEHFPVGAPPPDRAGPVADTTRKAVGAFIHQQMLMLPAGTDSATTANSLAARLPIYAVRRLMATEVAEYLRLSNAADTLALSDPKRWSRVELRCVPQALGAPVRMARASDTLTTAYLLELLCRSPELTSVVPNAIRLALSKERLRDGAILEAAFASDSLDPATPAVALIAADALDRVLRAVEKGHTNPQRFYVGGQLGMRLVGGDQDNGIIGRASVRAAYFIPISPFAYYQLPVVTNLGNVAAAPTESQSEKLKKLTTSSEGAFLSIEPTFDPWIPGPLKDIRVQLFGAVGGQINTLRDRADTSNVQVAQGRVGGGANIEIGIASNGHPNLFVSTRVVGRFASRSTLARVFGTGEALKPVLESFALIPIGAGVSILGEVSATRGSAPVMRVALWSQATPQRGADGK